MVKIIPTIRVEHKESGNKIKINQDDFNADIHKKIKVNVKPDGAYIKPKEDKESKGAEK